MSNNEIIKSPSLQATTPSIIEIEKMIKTIRGKQVILDRDLAQLYQVDTGQLNRQVKRNIERFPEDFMFQLSTEEFENLKCQNGISSWGGDRRSLPHAFTEQGLAMLSGVLRSDVAIQANIAIMRAFVAMRHFLTSNAGLFQRIEHIEEHQKLTDLKVEQALQKLDELSPTVTPEQIFATGCVWDAWAYLSDLVRSAKESIHAIDNFVDDRVLTLLTKRKENVSATIHTRYSKQFLLDLEKYNEQYEPIAYEQLPHKNHDRFLIVDSTVYLLGASIKDIGSSLCAITQLEVQPAVVLGMIH